MAQRAPSHFTGVASKVAVMIDLHSHILPGVDDGASDLNVALDMARLFQEQGVTTVACTPHILPGVYHNTGPDIRTAVAQFQREVDAAGLQLNLIPGADNHVVPDFVDGLRRGHLLSLGDTRYVLVEPPHHVVPPRLTDLFFEILVAGYVPILTHPERLSWIKDHYKLIIDMADRGVLMQITSGALLGRFGRQPKYWGERMLNEGRVHILASDAHGTERRYPDLAEGAEAAAQWVGQQEVHNLVVVRPQGIVRNIAPADLPPIAAGEHRGAREGGDHGREERRRRKDPTSKAARSGTHRGVFGRLRHLFGG
jgi:protein-tyrosine phosphatase